MLAKGAIPCTKNRAEHTGRKRSITRTHLTSLLGPREKQGAALRRRTSAGSRAPSQASWVRVFLGFCGAVKERNEDDLGTFIGLGIARYPRIFGIGSAGGGVRLGYESGKKKASAC